MRILRRNKKRSPHPCSARLSACPCCGHDTTIGRAAEEQEWRREAEGDWPRLTTVTHSNVCTCPPVYAALAAPTQPCPVHAYLWNGVTTTNKIGV